jgi:hypothetical protein
MRSFTAALIAALGGPVQQPAALVELGFSTPQRWSSFATLSWNALTWTREAIALDGLRVEALRLTGTLTIGNNDDVAAALVLAEGVTDRTVRIWGYDAAATATADVVWLADGVCGGATVSTDAVRIQLRHAAERTLVPRTFVDPATFGPLLPAGSVIKVGGVDYRIERRG